ncbi:hypothetical protein AUP68_04501 [Ilyonectria robusta]
MRTNVHPGSVLNGEQVYKPSIMFMPAATVNQAFNELTTLWRGVLDVYCLYHSRDNCTNPERKLRTLDNASEMQNLMDKLANEHLSPKWNRPHESSSSPPMQPESAGSPRRRKALLSTVHKSPGCGTPMLKFRTKNSSREKRND